MLNHHRHEPEGVIESKAIGGICVHEGSAEDLNSVAASDKALNGGVRLEGYLRAWVHQIGQSVRSNSNGSVLSCLRVLRECGSKINQHHWHAIVHKGLTIDHHDRLRCGASPTLILVSGIQEQSDVAADQWRDNSRDNNNRAIVSALLHWDIVVIEHLSLVRCREEGVQWHLILQHGASSWYQGHPPYEGL